MPAFALLWFCCFWRAAIQAYIHAYGAPEMLVWPAACFEYVAGVCLFLGYRARSVAVLVAGWCLLTALIFHSNSPTSIS